MSRSLWLLALLGFAILAIVGVVAVTQPVRVETPTGATAGTEPAFIAPVNRDAGSLDSLLDAIQLEHGMSRGR